MDDCPAISSWQKITKSCFWLKYSRYNETNLKAVVQSLLLQMFAFQALSSYQKASLVTNTGNQSLHFQLCGCW